MIIYYINPGVKEAEIIELGSSGLKEAVLCANLSFASDRFSYQKSCFISSGSRKQQAAVDR